MVDSQPPPGNAALCVLRVSLSDIHAADGSGRLLGGLVFAGRWAHSAQHLVRHVAVAEVEVRERVSLLTARSRSRSSCCGTWRVVSAVRLLTARSHL